MFSPLLLVRHGSERACGLGKGFTTAIHGRQLRRGMLQLPWRPGTLQLPWRPGMLQLPWRPGILNGIV
jgi:hypothetical protein